MNGWTLSWHGLRVVTGLEVRQRIRSRRWLIALAAWFVFIGAVTSLVIWSTSESYRQSTSDGGTTSLAPGALAFSVITFFVLGMGLVIAPTFTATSINGDRASGTLALLQATKLSALEIAAGKLLAAWFTSAVFLVVALPFIVWSMVLGSISLWQVAVCFAVVFALVAIVCAIGLGWSALISRAAGSAVMTYLSVVMLGIISPLVMALATPFTAEETSVRIWGLHGAAEQAYYEATDKYWEVNPEGNSAGLPTPPIGQCSWETTHWNQVHTERTWWLLVPNPFVIVADAAPLPDKAAEDVARYAGSSGDLLAGLRALVRTAAVGPAKEEDDCSNLYAALGYNVSTDERGEVHVTTENGTPVPYDSPVKLTGIAAGMPIWPIGLGVNLLIGAGFFWVAVRRLRVPHGVLPKGVRVA